MAHRRFSSSTGSPRRASRGGRCCRSGRPIARARRTSRRRLSLRGAGCWPIPTRRCRRPSARRSASATAFWIDDWAAFAGGTRALNDQVRFEREWSALRVVRARARRAPDRRRADLRRARQRRPRALARVLPRRRRGRRPARRLHRQGPALGQPDLRLARAAQPALPLVGRAPAPHLPALRPRAHRPLPRLRGLLGGAGAAPATPRAGAGRAGPAARSSTPRAASCAACR